MEDTSFDEEVFLECKEAYEKDPYRVNYGIPSENVAFRYAVCLIEHPDSEQVKKGIEIMRPLYEQTTTELRKQILFYLAKAEYKLKHYRIAKLYCEEMLKSQPDWYQVKSMLEQIDRSMRKDGFLGLLMVGGMLAFTGAIGTALTFAFVRSKGRD